MSNVQIFDNIPLPARRKPSGRGPTGKYPFGQLTVGACFEVVPQMTKKKGFTEAAMETQEDTLQRAAQQSALANADAKAAGSDRYYRAGAVDGRVFIWRTDERPVRQQTEMAI